MPLTENQSAFVFDARLDSKHLYSLYGNDYTWVLEIFRIAHTHFPADRQAIEDAWNKKDMDALKRSIHKIKPTFGFVGMPALQQLCKQVETLLAQTVDLSERHDEVTGLLTQCRECGEVLQQELTRLMEYNQSSA